MSRTACEGCFGDNSYGFWVKRGLARSQIAFTQAVSMQALSHACRRHGVAQCLTAQGKESTMSTTMETKEPSLAGPRDQAAVGYPMTGILTPRMAPGALAALYLAFFGSKKNGEPT
jgi:hypothetical protein